MQNPDTTFYRNPANLFCADPLELRPTSIRAAAAQRELLDAYRCASFDDTAQNLGVRPSLLKMIADLEQIIGDLEQGADQFGQQ